jgi:Leucine-rich repeat (LRR) protein
VTNLSSLSALEELNLSNNRIRQLPDLHTKLGNVKSLLLAQNRLTNLDGLGKLYGLVTLDVRSNKIADLETIRPVAALPCLEELTLTGNPVTTVLDFRTKVLTMFGKNGLFTLSVMHKSLKKKHSFCCRKSCERSEFG